MCTDCEGLPGAFEISCEVKGKFFIGVINLYDFVDELEEQRGKELCMHAEKRLNTSDKDVKEIRFVSQFKRTIMKYISESFRSHEDGRLWKLSR